MPSSQVKGIDAAQGLGGVEDIQGDDLIEQAGELGIGEADAVQSLELFAEVRFQRRGCGCLGGIRTSSQPASRLTGSSVGFRVESVTLLTACQVQTASRN